MIAMLVRTVAMLLIGGMALLALWHGGVLRQPLEQGAGVESAATSWRPQTVSEDTVFERLEGGELRLADHRGRVQLLNFWASWCPPCLKEFPLLLDLVHELDGRLVLVAISHDTERGDIADFLARLPPQYHRVLDSESVQLGWDPSLETSQRRFNVVYLPETFIIDPELVIRRKVVGTEPWWDREGMLDYLRGLGGGEAAPQEWQLQQPVVKK